MVTVLHMIPTLEGGGAERQLYLLATEQARRGLSVHVAIRRGGVHMQAMRDCGVQLHELGNFPSMNPKLFFSIRRILKSVEPDIVQTWLPQMDILGGFAALQSDVAWIMSERTSREYYAEIPFFAWLRLLLGQFASAIVANSEGGRNYWQKTVRRPVKLAMEVIVRAIGNLASPESFHVVMMGEGTERPRIEREIEVALLSARVKILPYQSDWWRWLKTADGLISMSRYEGNPNVVLEAMAGGCPVILSDISAHRELADASSAFFVPVDDVQALSAAIAQLIASQGAALQRAECASVRVGSMTIEAMADAYDAVYEDVLNRKS